MPRPVYHKLLRPSPKVDKYLGKLEAEVMEHLWTVGNGSVREVVEALRRRRAFAYTTVMTVMTRLTAKGLLRREPGGRPHTYRPAVSRDEFLSGLSRRVIDDLLQDFGEVAVVQFLEVLSELDPERLRTLQRLARDTGDAE